MYTPTELDLIFGIWKNGRTCIQFDPPKNASKKSTGHIACLAM